VTDRDANYWAMVAAVAVTAALVVYAVLEWQVG